MRRRVSLAVSGDAASTVDGTMYQPVRRLTPSPLVLSTILRAGAATCTERYGSRRRVGVGVPRGRLDAPRLAVPPRDGGIRFRARASRLRVYRSRRSSPWNC